MKMISKYFIISFLKKPAGANLYVVKQIKTFPLIKREKETDFLNIYSGP